MKEVFAKKSLGQHFLISEKAVSDMVEAGAVEAKDTVIEVGPGRGVLTRALLDKGANVIAIEKDEHLAEVLQSTFQDEIASGQLVLLAEDILTLSDWSKEKRATLFGQNYKVVANIPYYISGALFELFLSLPTQPKSITFLVQKEVALRAVAREGKESLLSLSIKCYGTPKYVRPVKRTLFRPIPKVDSGIITIINISRDFFINFSEKDFFTTIKKGFAHPRKLVKNNLELAGGKLTEAGIAEKARAEDLTLQDWSKLITTLQKN
jgi:16S rRNA (adenine1518-N6/adenine1519-N6)-dimethyltransferase